MAGMEIVGDPVKGRPTLGPTVPIAMFRAMRLLGMMQGLDGLIGDASTLVYSSGREVGRAMGAQLAEAARGDLGTFVELTVKKLADLGVGRVSIVEARPEDGHLVLDVDECITCSGMAPIGRRICHFEAGMISSVIEAFTRKPNNVVETRCNGTGDGVCRFQVTW
jgi:predicted hydrocarbon binding protein